MRTLFSLLLLLGQPTEFKMADALYLSFDLSTQTLKALVMNNSLHVIHESVLNFERDFPEFETTGGVYQNDLEATSPIQMWLKAMDVILNNLSEANVDIAKVKGISGTGQQHGSVYWKTGALEVLKKLDSKKTLQDQLKVSIVLFCQTISFLSQVLSRELLFQNAKSLWQLKIY